MITGRGREHLRVARPAETLVPLRAVRGHIKEIAQLPPPSVVHQLIQLGIARLCLQLLFVCGRKRNRREILRMHRHRRFDLGVAEAKEGEHGLHILLHAVGDVTPFRLGGTQIVPIEAALLQYLARLHIDALPLLQPGMIPQNARHVLSEIQHLLPLGRDDQLGLKHRYLLNAGRELRHHVVSGFHHLAGCRFPRIAGIIAHFAVINAVKHHGRRVGLPAFIRRNSYGFAICHGQRHPSRQQIPTAPDVFLAHQAKAALVPAVAQPYLKMIPLLQQRRHIIRLITQIRVIVVAAGRQVVRTNALPVQESAVQPQTRDLQLRLHNILRRKVPP